MTLSLRQWLILVGLIVAFGIAALLARGDGGGGTPDIDTAAWCAAATDLGGTGPLFDGTATTAAAADYEAAKEALFGVEVLAPFELRRGIARLADFTLISGQQLGELPWPDAWTAAREMIDAEEVDEAISNLDAEMSACGHQLFP